MWLRQVTETERQTDSNRLREEGVRGRHRGRQTNGYRGRQTYVLPTWAQRERESNLVFYAQ